MSAHRGLRRVVSLFAATLFGLSFVACGQSDEEKATERDAEECHEILDDDVPKSEIEVAVMACVMAKRSERGEHVDPGGPP